MEESGGLAKSCAVLCEAIRLKETCNPRKLWDHKHKPEDYQRFVRAVLVNAGIKDPSETETGMGMESAHDDHSIGQDEAHDYFSYQSPVPGENEVCGSPDGQRKNALTIDDDVRETDEASLSFLKDHESVYEYALEGKYKGSRLDLVTESKNSSDDEGCSVPRKKMSANSNARKYNNWFPQSQRKCDMEAIVKDVRMSRKSVNGNGVVWGGSKSIKKSNKLFIQCQSESDGETLVQKLEKSKKQVKGKSVVLGEGKSIKKSKKGCIEIQNESDAEAPVQKLEKSTKAFKRKNVFLGERTSIQQSNKRFIESQSESDEETLVQNCRKARKAVKGKCIRKFDKRLIQSQTGSDYETLVTNHGELRKTVKGKSVIQKGSKSIRKLNKLIQECESESDDEAPVKYIGMSFRKSNKWPLEYQSECDGEAEVQNVHNFKKAVKGKSLVRTEAQSAWKLNKQFMQCQSESDSESPELNGNSTEPTMGNNMAHRENKTTRKSNKRLLENHSKIDDEYLVQNVRNSGKRAKGKSMLLNMKFDNRSPEKHSEAGEDNQEKLGHLKRLKKIGDLSVKRPLGFSGLSRVEGQQQRQDIVFSCDVSTMPLSASPVTTPVNHIPSYGSSFQVQEPIKKTLSDVIFKPCTNEDGGLQGLGWYSLALRVDEDGDIANEFLIEVLPDASSINARSFEVNHDTRPANLKNVVLCPFMKHLT